MYFKMLNGKMYQLDHGSISNIHFDLASEIEDPYFDFASIKFNNALPFCKKI